MGVHGSRMPPSGLGCRQSIRNCGTNAYENHQARRRHPRDRADAARCIRPGAGSPRRRTSTLGVGGKSSLYYLPLTLTERLGYFKEQGLNVTINDFDGGSKSLQSLIGGSADVVTGAYEHTIRMQAKGQDIIAVLELGRFPGIVLAVRKDKADKIKSFGDLKGMKIGVTAPGSSTNFFVNALIAKDGVKPDDVSIIGVGAGLSAVAAMKKGEIDAISNLDPVITKLEQDGDVVMLADTRTEAGNMKLFGGNNPAAVVYFKTDFIDKNPDTVQASSTPSTRRSMAGEGHARGHRQDGAGGISASATRRSILAAVKASQPMYSKTGIITPEGMQNGARTCCCSSIRR